mmetsp:Transcript_18002/g.52178  ORF Transcript_18002/g.52178 Transcript_18002/m.52178 type:complete len:118 (-) Transcript_18002:25-378(-)
MAQDVVPHINKRQVSRVFTDHVVKRHNVLLNQKTVKSQATTTKRSAVATPKKFRWDQLFQIALNRLQEINTGRCQRTGKIFIEVAHHFIIGGNKGFWMDNHAGEPRVYWVERQNKAL